MGVIQNFEDIQSWQLARTLTKDIYTISSQGDFGRDYGLRGQICRAAVSISSNIAEGFERSSKKDFVNFLSIARGSAGEVRSQLYVALDLGYVTQDQFSSLQQRCKDILRLLSALIASLQKNIENP